MRNLDQKNFFYGLRAPKGTTKPLHPHNLKNLQMTLGAPRLLKFAEVMHRSIPCVSFRIVLLYIGRQLSHRLRAYPGKGTNLTLC